MTSSKLHLPADDLDEAIEFQRDIVGLRLAHVTRSPRAAFFQAGSTGNTMLGLWDAGGVLQRVSLHLAFRVALADIMAAAIATMKSSPRNRSGIAGHSIRRGDRPRAAALDKA